MTYAQPMMPPRRRRKLVPVGVPFDEMTPGQQAALLDLRRLCVFMEAEVERLITFLDFTDGYSFTEMENDEAEPTLEAIRHIGGYDAHTVHEDDEPSLCGLTAHGLGMPLSNLDTDAEQEADDEWSLGSVAACEQGNQTHWCRGYGGDVEEQHDGREPDHDAEMDTVDDEPSLGWPENVSQTIPNTSVVGWDLE